MTEELNLNKIYFLYIKYTMAIIEDFGSWKAKMGKLPAKPKRIYVDMDDVLCDYTGAYKESLKNNPAISYPQSQYGFFRNLKMLPNADRAMTMFMYASSFDLFDVHILTSPSVKNPLCYTEKRVWVGENLGDFWLDRLIIAPNKNLLIGDILIDDNITGRGQEKFSGELIHFGSRTYPDWNAIFKRTDDFMKFV